MTLNRKRHADLVDRMARTLGIDLEEKIMEGELSIETLSDAVLSCTGCSDPASCEHWVASQEEEVEEAPDLCRNRALFKLLKQGTKV